MENCYILAGILIVISVLVSDVKCSLRECFNRSECVDGLLIPIWKPVEIGFHDMIIRSVIYVLALGYIFFGVSIVSDRFMAAIERITSEEKDVELVMKNGQKINIRVRVWNETVSNLTLMALGSSAPEIMLSVIEVCGKDFQGGSLGPGTIVGSAAFNLFVIIAICMVVIPEGETRRIDNINVFFITASFSVIAYVWLYVILGVISIGIIEVWEALITFLLFPVTVMFAYMTDKELCSKFLTSCSKRKQIPQRIKLEYDEDIEEFERLRENYMQTFQAVRKSHPTADLQALEMMTITEMFEKSKKSRAFYKMQATRMLTGGGSLFRHSLSKLKTNFLEESLSGTIADSKLQRIFFEPVHYTIMEDIGNVHVTVKRAGGYLGSTVFVDYKTEDGTALAGIDYIECMGTLVFRPNETEKEIEINVINDEVFEEEEHFTILLHNLIVINGQKSLNYSYEISKMNRATIMILDDDHCGAFAFETEAAHVHESCGTLSLMINRTTGSRGIVRIPYKTIEGTAKENVDYISQGNKVYFKNEEIFKTINVEIIDGGEYAKDKNFTLELGEPKLIEVSNNPNAKRKKRIVRRKSGIASEGLPKLGEITKLQIHIHENSVYKHIVDKLILSNNIGSPITKSTWKEQFHEAMTVNGDVDEEEKSDPTVLSFILHYLALFWKVLFAFVPPTDYCGGWLCFVVSILCIGVLTALFGDLASSFGCTVGLLDEVVAITFVAVGTSLPDTFASKYAAINDESADNSVGNVTGSNAVNVYLGLGLSWSLASIVNASRGETFRIYGGASLGFSVTLFCILACIAIIIILLRRLPQFGGAELGGPPFWKYLSSSVLLGLYLLYVIISSLRAYCNI